MDFKLPDIAAGKVVPPEDPKIAQLERIAETIEQNSELAKNSADEAKKEASFSKRISIASALIALLSLLGTAFGWFPIH